MAKERLYHTLGEMKADARKEGYLHVRKMDLPGTHMFVNNETGMIRVYNPFGKVSEHLPRADECQEFLNPVATTRYNVAGMTFRGFHDNRVGEA